MQNTYYQLDIIKDGYVLKNLQTFGMSYNLLLSRINSLATFLGVGKSSAYFFDASQDPATRTVFCTEEDTRTGWKPSYGVPKFVHYRIMTPNGPSYMREWIDKLRSISGITPFPWEWTPSESDYWAVSNGKANSIIQNRMGVSARPILEMLFAIGRVEYHSGETHYIEAVSEVIGSERDNVTPNWVESKDPKHGDSKSIVGLSGVQELWDFPDSFATTLYTDVSAERSCYYYGSYGIAGPFGPLVHLLKRYTGPVVESTGVKRDSEYTWYKFYLDTLEDIIEESEYIEYPLTEEQIIQIARMSCEYFDKLGSDTVTPSYDWVELENISHVHTILKEKTVTPEEDNPGMIFGGVGEMSSSEGHYSAHIETTVDNHDITLINCDVMDENGDMIRVIEGGKEIKYDTDFTVVSSTSFEKNTVVHFEEDENLNTINPQTNVKSTGSFMSSDTEPATFADFYAGNNNTDGRYIWIKPNITQQELWDITRSQSSIPDESVIQQKIDTAEDTVKSLDGYLVGREGEVIASPAPAYVKVTTVSSDGLVAVTEEFESQYTDGEDNSQLSGYSGASRRLRGRYIYGEDLVGDCPAIHDIKKSSAVYIWWDQFVYPSGYPESLNPSS